ncbi:hypothetical protein A3F55_03000 [Candidatus Adlerbacteria bacterium RIFCSPHIGHO2_12_FULL_53_18]|uniref:Prepilin-type N-terminal cleavage/methylation domain-containing protein n=1 Tax=Candidatus Adlerbacteria bacterium RIFCSPHIGHO2_12_FULL_53_18 TaxID=1797242 RepID=A0A1F4XTC7_9BACT|nr:MAG: hypothetical protein A3F55_03000 [Candidatus Adlerbacteria bacterium RIFCSPHIGHO2_12_FULL_53_18]
MNNKGFTLIELMVSVTIFIVVMTISLGALLSISAAERKAEALKTVMNNLNFGLESMARTIRTGITYHCPAGGGAALYEPQDCSGGDDYFAFEAVGGDINDNGDQVVYFYEPDPLDCGANHIGGCIMRSVASGANPLPITASEINVTNLTFYVRGSVPEFESDPTTSQPKVVITLIGDIPSQVSAAGVVQSTQFRLQTSVTQRLYDQ